MIILTISLGVHSGIFQRFDYGLLSQFLSPGILLGISSDMAFACIVQRYNRERIESVYAFYSGELLPVLWLSG